MTRMSMTKSGRRHVREIGSLDYCAEKRSCLTKESNVKELKFGYTPGAKITVVIFPMT